MKLSLWYVPGTEEQMRILGFRGRSAFLVVALVLSAVPGMAACSPQHNLRVSAVIENGELIAVLTNTSNHPVRTVGKHVSAIPGTGGFYVRLQDVSGTSVKYCGMIDSPSPVKHWLRPNEKVVYRDTVASLANQYCLRPGKYVGRVVYYNSLMFGEAAYSEPIVSGVFEIVVSNRAVSNKDAKRNEKSDDRN